MRDMPWVRFDMGPRVTPHVVATSDLCVTLPERIADVVTRHLPLEKSALPLDLPDLTISQVLHARQHTDPAHAWLRALLLDAAASLHDKER